MNSGITIGIDLAEKKHTVCVLGADGEVLHRQEIANTRQGLERLIQRYPGALVVVESGTHSPWISRLLEAAGCRVLVGNPRKLRAIWARTNKSDVTDAEMLARLGRLDPKLLYPIHHRGEQAQRDLAQVKARDMLVQSRSTLVSHVRSIAKSLGERVPSSSTNAFPARARDHLSEELGAVVAPVLESIEVLSRQIKVYDQGIAALSATGYPETERLQQVPGVGPVTALAFVLTIEEPGRFVKSRSVGAFLGMTQRRDQSGETDRHLRITKAGDRYVRQLLVSCAHYILGPFGPECDLRRFGMKLMKRGGKNGKRRAVVAVARKLAVLLHRLWVTGAAYAPDYNRQAKQKVV
jgi:transposase